MGPRKSKGADTHLDDTTLVLKYLREQNRPYSAIEVSANLHNKVSKTQAVKVLRELHQNGDIEERTAGKQVVYHAVQNSPESVTPEIVARLNSDIAKLQNELTAVKADDKKARAVLAALEAKPLLSTLQQDIQRLEEERNVLEARLRSHSGGSTVSLSAADRDKLEQEWKLWQRHATLRRRLCRDLWGKCTEVLPENMSLQELWDSLGLEGTLQ